MYIFIPLAFYFSNYRAVVLFESGYYNICSIGVFAYNGVGCSGLFVLQHDFKILFSSSEKNVIQILMAIPLNL
jgi:hypothetical protein